MNAKTMTTPLNQDKPDTRPTGREIIAHMKMIKATVMQETDIEIGCLFLHKFAKMDKNSKEHTELFREIEEREGALLRKKVKQYPWIANCFYEKHLDGERENKNTEDMPQKLDRIYRKALQRREQEYLNRRQSIWTCVGVAFGMVVMLAYLIT